MHCIQLVCWLQKILPSPLVKTRGMLFYWSKYAKWCKISWNQIIFIIKISTIRVLVIGVLIIGVLTIRILTTRILCVRFVLNGIYGFLFLRHDFKNTIKKDIIKTKKNIKKAKKIP